MHIFMTATQQKHFEHVLLRQQAELVARRSAYLAGMTRSGPARDVLLQDGDDAAQRASDRKIDLQRVEEDVACLSTINAALVRIAAGTYGICRECCTDIPVERLEISAQTPYCVACEAQRECGRKPAANL
jgi:DnaK suppressor protein